MGRGAWPRSCGNIASRHVEGGFQSWEDALTGLGKASMGGLALGLAGAEGR
jgi:hypothetical protein